MIYAHYGVAMSYLIQTTKMITTQVSKKESFSTKLSSKPRAFKGGIRKIDSQCSLQEVNEEDLNQHHLFCHL